MTDDSLLPPNRSKLERDLERTITDRDRPAAPYGDLWDPWECPMVALPWLAWSVGVREWSARWSDERKRQAVASAMHIRRQAGTAGAVEEALKASVVDSVQMEEWFEYGGEPGTFRLSADLSGVGLSEADFEQLRNFVDRAKRGSAHLEALFIRADEQGTVTVGAASTSGTGGSLYPDVARELEVSGDAALGIAHQVGQAVTLAPYSPSELETSCTARFGATTGVGGVGTLMPHAYWPDSFATLPVAAAAQQSSRATLYPG